MTITVTYKNRSSSNYKFTTTDPNCSAVQELRDLIKAQNKVTNKFNKRVREGYYTYRGVASPDIRNTLSLRIRPRGPRDGATHDTPIENATHFDVYIKEYYQY